MPSILEQTEYNFSFDGQGGLITKDGSPVMDHTKTDYYESIIEKIDNSGLDKKQVLSLLNDIVGTHSKKEILNSCIVGLNDSNTVLPHVVSPGGSYMKYDTTQRISMKRNQNEVKLSDLRVTSELAQDADMVASVGSNDETYPRYGISPAMNVVKFISRTIGVYLNGANEGEFLVGFDYSQFKTITEHHASLYLGVDTTYPCVTFRHWRSYRCDNNISYQLHISKTQYIYLGACRRNYNTDEYKFQRMASYEPSLTQDLSSNKIKILDLNDNSLESNNAKVFIDRYQAYVDGQVEEFDVKFDLKSK